MTPAALWRGGVVSVPPDWPGEALGSAYSNYRQLEAHMRRTRMTYEEWLAQYAPIMGAEDEDDDFITGDPDDDDDIDDPVDRNADDDADDDSSTGDAQKQLDDMRRQLAAANQAARKAKQESRAERERVAKESGNWESVAHERESENEDLRERLSVSEERANLAEFNLDQFKRQVRVVSIATQFGFKDPTDAMALLKEEDTETDKTTERALRKLADTKGYLLDPRKASGAAMSGGGGSSGMLTMEQIKGMSQEDIAKNMDRVQASLANNGGGRT